MAYGQGRSLLYKEYGEEQAAEKKRYEEELAAIEAERRSESSSKGLWGLIGSVIGGLTPLGPLGMVLGKALGTAGADYAYDWESEKVTTDPGRFEKSQQYDFEQTNVDLEAMNQADFWRDVSDVGTTAALGWTLGGGTLKDPFATGSGGFTTWGGSGSSSAWDQLFKGRQLYKGLDVGEDPDKLYPTRGQV